MPPAPTILTGTAPVVRPEVIRKAYFAFSFSDIIRVNNVRQTGKLKPREAPNVRDTELGRTFKDQSIWERRSIKTDEGLKALMRRGVMYSSVVCVLIGSHTWKSRWVKYEIARAIIDGRGVFGIHLNNLNHHQRKAPDVLGHTPLMTMGVYHDANGKFYIYERVVDAAANGELTWDWQPYEDFTDPVRMPKFISAIGVGRVMPLAWVAREYDWVNDNGAVNIGGWIDLTAKDAGY